MMSFKHTERTQVKRPVAPPIDLDGGRLDVVRAALAGAFVLGALVVAILGAWVTARASAGYEPNPLGLAFGLGVTAVALTFGGVVLYISVTEWIDHRRRVQDWHTVSLAAYQEDGNETIEQVSEWELSTENPAHVLIAALWVQQRLQEGAATPYAVRNLRGPILLAHRRVGELSKLGAERMGQEFARLGLVEGRSEREAGEWVAESADQVVDLVLKRW